MKYLREKIEDDDDVDERGIVRDGGIFRPKDSISVAAGPSGDRLVILGGATLGGPRYIWWNFVSSSQQKIGSRPQGGMAQGRLGTC